MVKIQLNGNEWMYNPEAKLGKGGFASVFEGIDPNGQPIVVKTFDISNNSLINRELEIANSLMSRPAQHIMPILDAGVDANSGQYFIVMPRATKSLQQELRNIGKFDEKTALSILREIALGLNEVPDITHRDLKPDNILFHNGNWKIADFGIARFAGKETSVHTLKHYLTFDYAAPEQWRLERSTPMTDIYALGCIGCALLNGQPPFPGPYFEDYQEQHLKSPPPSLTHIQPEIRTLLLSMLRKLPESRPDLAHIIRTLSRLIDERISNKKVSLLAQAGAMDAEALLVAETKRLAETLEVEKRKELAISSFEILYDILEKLSERILDKAPTAKLISDANPLFNLSIKFGNSSLDVLQGANIPILLNKFENSGWDVICGAIITVIQDKPKYEWSANLWYTNLGKNQGYRWYEVMYYASPFISSRPPYEPMALDMYKDADMAASKTMATYELAAEPQPIDYEDIESFHDRWMDLLAKAYKGELQRPSRLPLD